MHKITGMKSNDFIAKRACGPLRRGAKRSKCPWGTRLWHLPGREVFFATHMSRQKMI